VSWSIQGPTGATGATGATGPQGTIGPSDAYVASGSGSATLQVPAGAYVIVGRVLAYNPGSEVTALCEVGPNGTIDFSLATIPHNYWVTLHNLGRVTVSGSSTITYACRDGGPGTSSYALRVVATKVGTIH